jgi:hypothetical protein
MKTEEEIPWTYTDPDNLQYGRRLSTYKFEFAEFDRDSFDKPNSVNLEEVDFDSEYWVNFIVDLEKYSMKQIMDNTESYYGNLDEIAKQYGKDFTWIVAECIFEQESGLY